MNEKALIKVLVQLKKENKDQKETIDHLLERTDFLYETIMEIKDKKK